MRVHQIERDVFHLLGERYESGTLAVLDGDRALLVDGMGSMADAARLREVVTVEWGKRVALLVSTHYFSDHLAAWNLFPDTPVIAQENALATFWTEDFRSPGGGGALPAADHAAVGPARALVGPAHGRDLREPGTHGRAR